MTLVPEAGRDAWIHLTAVLAELPSPPCAEQPDDWWTDTPTTGPVARCAPCPARDACLTYAVAADEQYGIWGGTTAAQRAAARR